MTDTTLKTTMRLCPDCGSVFRVSHAVEIAFQSFLPEEQCLRCAAREDDIYPVYGNQAPR